MKWRQTFLVTAFSYPVSKNRDSGVTTVDDFHQWANENKIIRSVKVCQDDDKGGGKGLVATRDLKPREIAIHVPRKMTIQTSGELDNNNWAGTLASKICQIQSEIDNESNNDITIDFGGDQAYTWKPFSWKPYIEYGLPEDGPYTTSHWEDSELLQLQNETLVHEAYEWQEWREEQYARFSSNYSRENFDRALSLVLSRVLDAGEGSHMLVPFIDNANHASKEEGGGTFQLGSNSIVLMAGEYGVKKGEPFTLNYGNRCADDFALTYGFVPHDCIGDSIPIPATDSIISWDTCFSQHGHADRHVRRKCSEILASYPTNLAEDEKMLRNQKSFDALTVALGYRCAKKRLLSKAAGI